MLHELAIENLGVIESARVSLGRGLTCVTGETGAGKTMVLTGLGLILGAKADAATVRAGASEAVAEAVFDMPDAAAGLGGDVTDVLAGLSPRERACVTLRYIDQLSTAETAHALGIAEGSVKRYLADASHKIAQLVATEGGA